MIAGREAVAAHYKTFAQAVCDSEANSQLSTIQKYALMCELAKDTLCEGRAMEKRHGLRLKGRGGDS
jgi:hypothetical protein